MIPKGLIESSYKIVSNVNLKLNVEITSKDTDISNNDVEQVSSPEQSVLTDTPSDIHLSTKHEPIALEQLNTFFFFLSGFSFTNIHDSRDSRGKGRVSI